jgi:hypothetical protein
MKQRTLRGFEKFGRQRAVRNSWRTWTGSFRGAAVRGRITLSEGQRCRRKATDPAGADVANLFPAIVVQHFGRGCGGSALRLGSDAPLCRHRPWVGSGARDPRHGAADRPVRETSCAAAGQWTRAHLVPFTEWCAARGIEVRFIQSGKPAQNPFIERFDKTYRLEVLDAYVFETVEQVRKITQRAR